MVGGTEMISKELAQKVADQIMADIEYNINVMDVQGRIIASGESERIGDIHQGARDVIDSKQRNVIYENTLTEKQGINDPLFIAKECIGVVGISGPPDEVMKIKNVVNSLFYFLISREIEINKKFSEKEYRQKLIRKMLYQEVPLTIEETDYLSKHQFDYTEEKYLVVTSGRLNTYTNGLFYHEKSDGKLVLILSVQQTKLNGGLSKVLSRLLKEVGHCGVSKISGRLSLGYKKALGTLEFSQIIQQPLGLYYYRDYRLFVNALKNISSAQDGLYQKLLLIKQDESLYQTLLCLFRQEGQMKLTAEALIIHRNTLIYRLNKIKDLTGIDPSTVTGLTNLVYGLMMLTKENKEASSN